LKTLTLSGTLDLPSDVLDLQIHCGNRLVFVWESGSERLQGFVRIEVPCNVSVLGDFFVTGRCRTSELRYDTLFRLAFSTIFLPLQSVMVTQKSLDLAPGNPHLKEDFFLKLLFQELDAPQSPPEVLADQQYLADLLEEIAFSPRLRQQDRGYEAEGLREASAETLDLELLTQMFQIKATAKKKPEAKAMRKGEKREPLTDKRIQAIGIGLKFLKLPTDRLVAAILAMDDKVLDAECVQGLRTILPSEEEVKEVRDFLEETKAEGTPAQQFVRGMGTVPRLAERLACWTFANQFHAECAAVAAKMDIVNGVIADLMGSAEFKNVLALILNIGNRLNANTNRVAMGFTIEELPKLAVTKSVDNTSTLLEYVVQMMAQKHPEWLRFTTDLQKVATARTVSMKDVHSMAGELRQGLHTVTEQVELAGADKSETVDGDQFVPFMRKFLDDAEAKVADLSSQVGRTQAALAKLCEYFGSDAASFDESEFFGAIAEFCGMVQATHKQLKAREDKAAKQKVQAAKPKRLASKPPGPDSPRFEPSSPS